jgi:hypothetical protein
MAVQIDLVICFVAPIGTDVGRVSSEFESALKLVRYNAYHLHLTDSFSLKEKGLEGDKRLEALMNEGDRLRQKAGRNDAVAAIAVKQIKKCRDVAAEGRGVVLVRQLKTPEEIASLRGIYGSRLFVVSCYASRDERVARLARSFATCESDSQSDRYRQHAEKLVLRDEHDGEQLSGQNVRKAFPEGDAFISVGDPEVVRKDVLRIVEVLFGHPYRTPSRDEFGMYLEAVPSSAI